MLDERLIRELKAAHQELKNTRDGLHSPDQLAAWYSTFRARFGPERLRELQGPELLSTLHDHGRRDSLVYWLEFKDDEELPAIFGSIAGGSALKFGLYRRKETGAWMTGSPMDQQVLTQDEAIQFATRNRDQLLRAAEGVAQLPVEASDADYQRLQWHLEREAPDVNDSAWGHKYLSMLFPEKLDAFHNEGYQRFHLIKLLQDLPAAKGRYLLAGRFVSAARELGWPLNTLARVLNHRHGNLHRYWRIGTSDGMGPANRWSLMRDGECVAIGWPNLGDLSHLTADQEGRERLKALLHERHPKNPQQEGKDATQVFNFIAAMEANDLVLAAQGQQVLGIARVTGGYSYVPDSDFPHRRQVEWLSLQEFELPHPGEGLQRSVCKLTDAVNLVDIEHRLLGAQKPFIPPKPKPPVTVTVGTVKPLPPLSGLPGRIQAALERKGQVILYGPPGTGKTHVAELTARDLAAHTAFGQAFDVLSDEQKAVVTKDTAQGEALVRMCSFHPAYGYEEFIEGYRPRGDGGQMRFELRDGIFKKLCADARRRPERRFFLIVDEINRGDIPRIMGELLTVLEKSKRGKSILLPMSGEAFHVPDNVYLIGTMNTADRSIALLDTALRRRFGFVELMPDYSVLGKARAGDISVGAWLEALNERICKHVGRDGRNLQVGHAYLMGVMDLQRFSRVLQDELIPLLEEYCYEDWEALARILGHRLVDAQAKQVRHELFEPARQQELVQALKTGFPEVASSGLAVEAEAGAQPPEEEDSPDADTEAA
jgi:5-methylcytosine-specific restriction protein B